MTDPFDPFGMFGQQCEQLREDVMADQPKRCPALTKFPSGIYAGAQCDRPDGHAGPHRLDMFCDRSLRRVVTWNDDGVKIETHCPDGTIMPESLGVPPGGDQP